MTLAPGTFGNPPHAAMRAASRAAAIARAGGDVRGVPPLGAPGHFDRTRAAAAGGAAAAAPGPDAWEIVEPPGGVEESVGAVLQRVGESVVDAKEAFDARAMDGVLPAEEVAGALQALELPQVELVRD